MLDSVWSSLLLASALSRTQHGVGEGCPVSAWVRCMVMAPKVHSALLEATATATRTNAGLGGAFVARRLAWRPLGRGRAVQTSLALPRSLMRRSRASV
jgi:hypothetical protein